MSRTRVTAVVWHADDRLPEALVAALDRQGIEWQLARGPFDAMSRMLAGREGRSRSGRVLLLVEAARLTRVDEVRKALERFDPSGACWAYDGAASPKLSPVPPLTREPEPEVVVRPAPPRRGAGLRLAGDSPEEPENGDRPAASPRSVLTPEELTMLLSEDETGRR